MIKKSKIRVMVRFPFQVLGGDFASKRKRKQPKCRSFATFTKIQDRLRARYNRLSRGPKFSSKYPTFEAFLEKHKIKQPTN